MLSCSFFLVSVGIAHGQVDRGGDDADDTVCMYPESTQRISPSCTLLLLLLLLLLLACLCVISWMTKRNECDAENSSDSVGIGEEATPRNGRWLQPTVVFVPVRELFRSVQSTLAPHFTMQTPSNVPFDGLNMVSITAILPVSLTVSAVRERERETLQGR